MFVLVLSLQIKNVKTHEKEDRMESFFLAETTKYLYLLFDEHNFIHQNNGSLGLQIKTTTSPSCTPESAGYIFNTEAHPIDIGAIHCCSASKLTRVPKIVKKRRTDEKSQTSEGDDTGEGIETFTGSHTCKARSFHKRMSLLGAFLEDSESMSQGMP